MKEYIMNKANVGAMVLEKIENLMEEHESTDWPMSP